eukprot:TRINITY_DN11961_c0_g1_i5.p1 TRINITY_DN11961_c0_g1~~TRINITY_DN11961_c0_g1_i5.p1  ORF type:complete len:167 (+),score=27.88 TRINITY_DN11961_c0_g1_i5:198-698(+)
MREAHRKTAVELSGCCRQLAAGVEYLHEELVCHRDIQPCNVLLVDSDLDTVCVKLIEFSTAKDFEKGVASMRTKVCTPSYVAPEILSQDEADRRSHSETTPLSTLSDSLAIAPWPLADSFGRDLRWLLHGAATLAIRHHGVAVAEPPRHQGSALRLVDVQRWRPAL